VIARVLFVLALIAAMLALPDAMSVDAVCGSDSECMEMHGGDGGPVPVSFDNLHPSEWAGGLMEPAVYHFEGPIEVRYWEA